MRRSLPGLIQFGLILVLLFSTLGAVVVPNPFTQAPSQPPAPPRTVAFTDVNIVGANFFLDREVETWKKEQTLSLAKEAGIGWAKIHFAWEGIEPRKNHFVDDKLRKSTWEKYDEIVVLTQKYGLKIIARLDRPPNWTRQDNRYRSAPPDDFDDYANFVAAVVSRYKGQIQYYQIWNEPNIFPEWGDRPVDPAGYVRLLRLAYQRAKAIDPNVLILSAPLAQTLERGPQNLNELDYLEEMYKAGAQPYFDILSANAYGFDRPPSDPPDKNVLNFQRVQLVRDIMVKHGDANKPIWINEFGWNAAPENFPPTRLFWGRVSESDQARYSSEGLQMARSWGWVGVVNFWFFRQVGDIPPQDRADYYFRIVDVDFTPRLLFYTLQEYSAGLKVAPAGYHEESSPAASYSGDWQFVLVPEASGGSAAISSVPGSRLIFTFFGTGLSLLHAKGPGCGRLQVKIDGRPANLLTRDQQGDSYLELAETVRTFPVRSSLAEQLPVEKHRAEFTLVPAPDGTAPDAGCAIDGFEVVNAGQSLSQFYVFLALFALSILLLGISIVARRAR